MRRHVNICISVLWNILKLCKRGARWGRRKRGAIIRSARQFSASDLRRLFRLKGDGWYGSRPLMTADTFPIGLSSRQLLWLFPALPAKRVEAVTDLTALDPRIFPYAQIEAQLALRTPSEIIVELPKVIRYSLVTLLDHALVSQFDHCITSVSRLVSAAERSKLYTVVEWTIITDGLTEESLLQDIPEDLLPLIAFSRVDRVVETAQRAMQGARGDWLVFIEAGVDVSPIALATIDWYARQNSACRFMASAFAESSKVFQIKRVWDHAGPASRLFELPNSIDGIKAIRTDLAASMQHFHQSFAQAFYFDLALRIATKEPILFVPEILCLRMMSNPTSAFHRQPDYITAIRNSRLNLVQSIIRKVATNQFAFGRKVHRHPVAIARGACIIRTQGKRLELLRAAIASVEQQQVVMQVLLVVHGDFETFEYMSVWCSNNAPGAVCLRAGQPGRRRGYPLNVGIDYLARNADQFDFVSILDDDDILYPAFASRMTEALEFREAGLVYCQSNRREPWRESEAGPSLLPSACLLGANFIPINAFALSVAELVATGVRFSEEMEYLEDWDFLVRLLHAGVVFRPVFETLSEFRIFGDGNTEARRYPSLYAASQHRIAATCIEASHKLGVNFFYSDVSKFDYAARGELTTEEIAVVESARRYFEAFPDPELAATNYGRGVSQ